MERGEIVIPAIIDRPSNANMATRQDNGVIIVAGAILLHRHRKFVPTSAEWQI